MRPRYILLPFAALALAGCVTVPTGPGVMALPGSTKSFDQFRADDVSCRQYAQYSLGPYAEQAVPNAATANAVGGAALGAAAGAIIGAASGQAGPGAAIGAGTGLLFGSFAGADAAGYSYYGLQRRYDAAYLQCMYARGNQVPGGPRYAPRRYGPPPGYGVPPDYVPPPAG
jgi:Glycine-zipper domain